jgi:shikimate dehydrogenase
MINLHQLRNFKSAGTFYGVIGDPIVHSLSPQMQQAAFDYHGIPAKYDKIHLRAEEFTEGIDLMRRIPFAGWNCTVPHKVSMLTLCDELSETARRFGSVNTVVNQAGKLIGHNTDGIGWSRAVSDAFGIHLKGIKMVLLGAGGASRAIALQALSEGVAKVYVANRSRERGKELVLSLGRAAEFMDLSDRRALVNTLSHSRLVVNATSAGLDGSAPPILTAKEMHPKLLVFDTIYGPGAEKLRLEAKRAKVLWCNGLRMLLHQGASASHLWTCKSAPLEMMLEALKAAGHSSLLKL